jgi:hypothetical protein
MVKFLPWSALPLMDILHRINIPYHDYAKALGPVLPLGLAGLVLALIRQDKKMLPFICWVISVGVLFLIFERVPQQSPLRFTEAEIHIPLGILATYLFLFIAKWNKWLRRAVYILITVEVLAGLFVMWSMVGWLTDQVKTKKIGTWSAPLGVQLAYPLKDFMAGIEFFRLHTNTDDVVLTYITAGNYIPAYSGNHVYIGHINTPDEDKREVTSARFFSGKMKNDEAKELLQKENISYIFFGPQEKEIAWIPDLETVYPQISLERVYTNQRVIIYKVKNR